MHLRHFSHRRYMAHSGKLAGTLPAADKASKEKGESPELIFKRWLRERCVRRPSEAAPALDCREVDGFTEDRQGPKGPKCILQVFRIPRRGMRDRRSRRERLRADPSHPGALVFRPPLPASCDNSRRLLSVLCERSHCTTTALQGSRCALAHGSAHCDCCCTPGACMLTSELPDTG